MDNLTTIQKVCACILAVWGVFNIIPDSVMPMTKSAHYADTNFTKENLSLRNVSYHLKRLCADNGTANDERELARNFRIYAESTGTPHWNAGISRQEQCEKVQD